MGRKKVLGRWNVMMMLYVKYDFNCGNFLQIFHWKLFNSDLETINILAEDGVSDGTGENGNMFGGYSLYLKNKIMILFSTFLYNYGSHIELK